MWFLVLEMGIMLDGCVFLGLYCEDCLVCSFGSAVVLVCG